MFVQLVLGTHCGRWSTAVVGKGIGYNILHRIDRIVIQCSLLTLGVSKYCALV